MLTATVDMSGFNAGMAGLIRQCRLHSRVVVKKEAGELIKELVLRSPPKTPKKTRDAIATGIHRVFDTVSDDRLSDTTGIRGGFGTGPSGIRWYSADSRFLHGIAPKNDKTGASVAELERIRFTTTKSGKQILSFKHPRKRQRVLLSQQILTKKSTVQKLIAKTRKHVGRLKAGWLVSVAKGAIQISGSNMPPAWVTVHAAGARGRFDASQLNTDNPSFMIANSAKGITQKGIDFIVQLAVKSRAAAMVTNARMMFSGKKRLSDYAK